MCVMSWAASERVLANKRIVRVLSKLATGTIRFKWRRGLVAAVVLVRRARAQTVVVQTCKGVSGPLDCVCACLDACVLPCMRADAKPIPESAGFAKSKCPPAATAQQRRGEERRGEQSRAEQRRGEESTVHHSTAQHSTQCSAVQRSAARRSWQL